MDKVTGLMTGADDYVTKPFSPVELVARVDALYRRLGNDSSPESAKLRYGPFVMNLKLRTLDKNGKRVKLTQMEYAVMKLFLLNPGQALSREAILTEVWGKGGNVEEKIVDVNVRRLRLKLEEDPTNPEYMLTVWGFGYKLGNSDM
jgi:DNA-binding response OmpR family regulator